MSTASSSICCRNFNSNGTNSCHSPILTKPCNFRTAKTTLKNMGQPDKLFLNFKQKYGIISWAIDVEGKYRVRASSSSASPSPKDTTPSNSPWKKWLMGIVLTVVLPAAGHKGGLILALKGKIDQTIAAVDQVTEIVEDIAEAADKLVEEVEEKLPDDCKLKETLESFENLTEVAVKQARKAEDLIHKVKETEDQIAAMLIDTSKDEEQK